jgi:signal transduction histidine kinase
MHSLLCQKWKAVMGRVRLYAGTGTGGSVRSRQPRWQLALNAAIVLADLSFFSNITEPSCTWGQRALEVGFAILGYGALRWRSSRPVLSYGIGWIYASVPVLLTILNVVQFTPFFALLVILFTIASEQPLLFSRITLAACAVPIGLDLWFDVYIQSGGDYLSAFIASAVFYLAATAATYGVGVRSGSARRAVEHHRREHARASEAASRASRAAAEERQRIARELHDILSHTITIMVLQASGARRILTADPGGAEDALSRVEQVGKQAMSDLGRMLALVRSPAADGGEAAQRGLADIEGLFEDLSRAGITARLDVQGDPFPVAESVSRTVYRIVQEATTNIIKHAGPGTVAIVRLTWGADLRIEIVDHGGGKPEMEAAAFSTGHGLIGLKERVAVFGGELTAGPRGDGFCVLASLPLRGHDAYLAPAAAGFGE